MGTFKYGQKESKRKGRCRAGFLALVCLAAITTMLMLCLLPVAWAQPPQEHPHPVIPESAYQISLQSSVDHSSGLPPVKDQGKQQSCSAWATHYYAKTWYEGRKHPEWDLSDPRYQFSPAFAYNQVVIGQDEGSSLEQNLFVL